VTAILVPAYPALLRAGLPVVYCAWVGEPAIGAVIVRTCDDPVVILTGDVHTGGIFANRIAVVHGGAFLSLDLRDPAVRDAAVRALWRKLRPVEPEPLTAPAFGIAPNGHAATDPHWLLYNGDLVARFMAISCFPRIDHAVPALASIDLASPDRDLLALACVLAAVLS
jgi:hypothetical protein